MELKVIYNLSELRDLAKRFPAVVAAETEAVLDLIVRKLEKDVVEGTPAGVGGVAGLRGKTSGKVVGYGQGLRGVVGTPLEYGIVIEEGRRPNKRRPPADLLVPWVRSILGVSGAKEQRSVAFLLARHIGRFGFKGRHMFSLALERNRSWIQAQLYTIGDRVARRVNKGGSV